MMAVNGWSVKQVLNGAFELQSESVQRWPPRLHNAVWAAEAVNFLWFVPLKRRFICAAQSVLSLYLWKYAGAGGSGRPEPQSCSF